MAINSPSTSMLWRCPFIRVYFLWKSGPYMSKVDSMDMAHGHALREAIKDRGLLNYFCKTCIKGVPQRNKAKALWYNHMCQEPQLHFFIKTPTWVLSLKCDARSSSMTTFIFCRTRRIRLIMSYTSKTSGQKRLCRNTTSKSAASKIPWYSQWTLEHPLHLQWQSNHKCYTYVGHHPCSSH